MMTTTLPERHLELTKAALQLQQAGFNEDALELIEKAIRLAPGYSTAYVLQGLSLQALGHMEQAVAAFHKAIQLDPKNDQAQKSLGLFLAGDKKYKEAIPLLAVYQEKYPDDKFTLDVLISALTATGDQKKIQALLEKNWEKTKDTEIGIRLSRFMLGQGNNESALSVVEKVVEISRSPRTLTELSLVLVVLEKYQEAIEALNEVLEIDPSFDRALRGLSFCYTKLGQMDDAIEFADKALAINNKHYRNWQAKGDALLALGKFEDALFTSQTALDLIDLDSDPEAEPVMEVLYLQRFNALLGLDKEEEALLEIEKARKILPREERFYIYPAQLLLGRGQAKQAAEIIEKAQQSNVIHLFPSDLRIQILLAAGMYKKLWDWLDPQLSDQVIGFLISTGYQVYLNGESDISKQVFQHLLDKFPDQPQFATYLSFILTGDGEYQQAETLLASVIAGKEEEIKPLANCNLGFVFLETGKLESAKSAFLETLSKAMDTDEAIVRVGFWQKEPAELCCTTYPVQSYPLKMAAKANLVAIHLQQDEIAQAETLASQIVEDFPSISLSYQVLGSVEDYRGNYSAARENWEKAIQLSSDPIETQMIQEWLAGLRGLS